MQPSMFPFFDSRLGQIQMDRRLMVRARTSSVFSDWIAALCRRRPADPPSNVDARPTAESA